MIEITVDGYNFKVYHGNGKGGFIILTLGKDEPILYQFTEIENDGVPQIHLDDYPFKAAFAKYKKLATFL